MKCRSKQVAVVIAVALAVSTVSCRDVERKDSQNTGGSGGGKTMESFSRAGRAKIFFGHQSVGGNILEGVGELARENPGLGLRIVAGSQASDLKEPAIAHAAIGTNDDPQSKIRAFVEIVDRGVGEAADIAGMKFCYVDITSGTDIEKLFAVYRESMAGIRARYPNLTLIHFTAPLTSIESPLKSFVKKILGKPLSGKLDNIRRNEYNARLNSYYRGKEPVFDLAAAESTTPEGITVSYPYAGGKYPMLFSEYTDDGGHLNALGRRIVGAKFLEALGTTGMNK